MTWVLDLGLLRVFDFFEAVGEVVAGFDFAAVGEANEVGLLAHIGIGGDFLDEVAGGFDFLFGVVPFLSQVLGGGFGIVGLAVAMNLASLSSATILINDSIFWSSVRVGLA
jgi:hypothetical protein